MHKDLYLDGRAKISSYRTLLESLLETGLPALTHAQAWAAMHGEAPARYLCVRHDVDHSLEIALEMARIEAELGIAATYFLLPPGDYDKDENYYGKLVDGRIVPHAALAAGARELVELGHEVGLHNDFLQLSQRLGRPVAALIAEEIGYFKGLGIQVVGSASHGSRYARRHEMVNYELFAECQRPTSQLRDVALEGGGTYRLFSLHMAELGLTYEAYSLRRDLYISDTGSRFYVGGEYHDVLAPTMMADLVGANQQVVALIHPEWWKRHDPTKPLPTALGGANAALHMPAATAHSAAAGATTSVASQLGTDLPSFRRSDGKPLRVAVRGDCCSRRAVVMNKALFPHGVSMVINEKCPNVCFQETLDGHGAPSEAGLAVSAVGAMTGSLKHYYVGQFERSVLEARDLDLLVMDNYSDMNFELWRHREQGWSLWIHPKFVADPEGFKARFERLGHATLEAAVDAVCAVIDAVRANNPGVPVLMLNQPIEYYPKLDARKAFYGLGAAVASRRPDVYAAKALTREQLTPADMNSCGPGQTLHFDAETYLRMIADAWAQGLARHFVGKPAAAALAAPAPAPAPEPAPAPAHASVPTPTPQPAPAPTPPAPPAERAAPRLADDGLPMVALSYAAQSSSCVPGCEAQVEAAFKTYAQYFRHPESGAAMDVPPRFTPMLIDTADIADFAAWEGHIKTFGKGARLRQKRKAEALGCVVKPFAWKLFIPDVHEINHSKTERSGGAMRGSYLRSVEEMGGAPQQHYTPVMPSCERHWSLQFGAFLPQPGHLQGSLQVDEKLLAYISLRRCGDVALYSMILGHGDYLNQGVLVLLHHEVIRWLSEQRDGYARDLRWVMYGGMQNGGDSLFQFKRQSGFTPHHVYASAHAAPLAALHERLSDVPA